MSDSRLAGAIRVAVVALRQIADSLESALGGQDHESARTPNFAPAAAASSAPWEEVSQISRVAASEASNYSTNSYHEVANLLTQVPEFCVDLCSRLGGPRPRAQRAWEAGTWARAVLEGKISKPRPTPKVNQPPAIYVVLKAPGVSGPVLAYSAAEYYKILPKFTPDSLSHSFPSKAEAKVYCLAAGVVFPGEQ